MAPRVVRAMQQVKLTTTATAEGAANVEQQVGKGAYAIGVILPPDFSLQLEAYAQSSGGRQNTRALHRCAFLIDPAQPQAAGMANGAIFAAVQRVMGPLYREASLAQVPVAFREFAQKKHDGAKRKLHTCRFR